MKRTSHTFPLCTAMARDERLIKCCTKGWLDALQTLVLVEGVDPHARNGEAFCYACHAGQLHVAQWLRDQPGFDLPACGNEALAWACAGRQESPVVAQWLKGVMDGANLRPDVHRAFSNACYCRNLAVAKWVLGVAADLEELDIHGQEDALIRHVVSPNTVRPADLGLGRWLLSLDPQWPSWPAWAMDRLKVWSRARDAWMRGCVHV
jgi:hypothetical protein